MEAIKAIVIDLLGSAPILVGIMALVGLCLQKKSFDEVFTGTVKTITGYLVFGIGSSAAAVALSSFQTMFAKGFGMHGAMPLAEILTALAQQKFGSTIAMVMAVGFIMNIVIARFTPLKYIFLTGQESLFFAAMLTVILMALGMNPSLINLKKC